MTNSKKPAFDSVDAFNAEVWHEDGRRVIRQMILLLALMVGSLILWASAANIDRVVRGEGKVIPSSHVQVIQSPESGVIRELLVRSGDRVQAGQLLVKIDDVQFSANLEQSKAKAFALTAQIARLKAEAGGEASITFPKILTGSPEVVAAEKSLFLDRQKELREAQESITTALALNSKQMQISAPLVEQGLVSELEVLRLRSERNDLLGRKASIENSFRSKAGMELSDKEAELASVREALPGVVDRVKKTDLRSPLTGIVKQVNVTTIGGVVNAGEAIMEVVPVDDELLIEAYVSPSDVAFLAPGSQATVRVTAFDSAIYGALNGQLDFVSADSVYIEALKGYFFRVVVRTDQNFYLVNGNRANVSSGMTATVDIRTGSRTLLEYLLKPIIKVRQVALSER